MKLLFSTVVTAAISLFLNISETSAYIVDDNPFRHFVTLDPDGKYQLEWLVDWDMKKISFNVTVATSGYIGFGLSKRGKMAGADIVIGGVYPNGKSYFTDRYAIANQLPEIDPSQDWTLHSAYEHGGQTILSFSRAFDTCDPDHDLPITDDSITIIWAYSEVDDQLQYHFQTRGTYEVYLLDPDLTPRSIDPDYQKGKHFWKKNGRSDMNLFRMTKHMVIPPQETVYWCSFHKVPTTNKKHIIGWNTVFPTDKDRMHVHHLLVHRCTPPKGVTGDVLFEGAAMSGGSECYFLQEPNPLPIKYCRETIHVWAVNGRAIFFPSHAGQAMSESGPEWFMVQVHYDNPNLMKNLNVTVSLDAYYTDNLRKNDVGLFQMGEQIPGSTSIIIPPSSLDHVVMGHCAEGCTEKMLPDEGVSIFAGFLHTHIAGRSVKLMHIRKGEELPWILADENYNFDYQQFRILREERKLYKGDLLINRCVYDTSDRNGSVVVGGFSTREEMCTSFLYYYSRSIGYGYCRSEIRSEDYWNLLGIKNTTWIESRRAVVVTKPLQFAGMTIRDFANDYIKWDLSMREAVQKHHLFKEQVSQCPRVDLIPEVRKDYDDYGLSERKSRFSPRITLFSKDYEEHDDSEHVSINPKGIARYRRPPQCSKVVKVTWH